MSTSPLLLRGNLGLGLVVAPTHGNKEIVQVVDGKKTTVADLFQHPDLATPERGATTGRTQPANHRLVSVTATARMPTVPK